MTTRHPEQQAAIDALVADGSACCGQFAEAVYDLTFERVQFSDGLSWAIPGCCGGGCYVTEGLKFCPFCGRELSTLGGTNAAS